MLFARQREQLFVHFHQVAIVAVGLVEFQHGEFGVVLRRDAFIPEIPVDLVHPVKSADRQPFQIELRRDTQIKIDVQVYCDE